MHRFFHIVFGFLLTLAPVTAMAQDSAIQTSATNAIVVDYDTGTVLLEKNPDAHMPTSSMSKVMTAYYVFDGIKRGDFTLQDEFTVSEKAWRMGGSKMFIEVGKGVKIEDLLRGLIIQSGNDASITLAEGVAGTEEAFAEALTAKAKQLGMNNSQFRNASGWPDEAHYSTARDLSILATSLIRDFPEFYKYYSQTEFTYNGITQQNRNPLLYKNIGADGVKTGYTEAAGYGLIGSGVHNGRRVILVVNGLLDPEARAAEATKLLEWGLKQFDNRKFFAAGSVVENVSVALGAEKTVQAQVLEDVVITLPRVYADTAKVTAKFMEPIPAPVTKGQEIGTLEIAIPGGATHTKTLYAAADVGELGFFARAIAKAQMTLAGGR